MTGRRAVTVAVAVSVLTLVSACSGSGHGGGSGKATATGTSSPSSAASTAGASAVATPGTPLVTPAPSPTGMTPVDVGTVSIDVPDGMTPLSNLGSDSTQQVVGYRSAPDPAGVAGVILITAAASATRSAQAEAQALVGLKHDVDHSTGIAVTPITWPGFTSAYAVTYDDKRSGSQTEGLHTLVVIAQTTAGPLVNVTAKAPAALFASLDLAASVASLKSVGSSA